jgi:hypothetical protein
VGNAGAQPRSPFTRFRSRAILVEAQFSSMKTLCGIEIELAL